jgi:hypothetical protein
VPRGVLAEAKSGLLLVYQLGLLHLRQGIHLPRLAAAPTALEVYTSKCLTCYQLFEFPAE